jgi:prevent-host-death family protein
MSRTVPIAEAKATFSHWIRLVENGEPVLITRHGQPVAALVPAADVEQLERLRAAGPEGGLASLAGGWEGSDELVRRIEELVRRGRRPAEPLD